MGWKVLEVLAIVVHVGAGIPFHPSVLNNYICILLRFLVLAEWKLRRMALWKVLEFVKWGVGNR